jgi:hypothetical protein
LPAIRKGEKKLRTSIQAIKEAGGWRVRGIMVQEEPASMRLPEEYLP